MDIQDKCALQEEREWVLKRNCSLTPRQLLIAYGLQCFLSFIIGLVFLLRGLPYVLLFAVIAMSIVGVAFMEYARHATDHEHLAFTDGGLLVECVQAGKIKQVHLDAYWIKVNLSPSACRLIHLEAKGIKVEVGRFVTEAKRREVMQELKRELRGGMMAR